jgi:cellulose biosynthesis protein BcsQ
MVFTFSDIFCTTSSGFAKVLKRGVGRRRRINPCARLLAEHLRKTYGCRVLLVETRFARRGKQNPEPGDRDFASWLRGDAIAVSEDEDGEIDIWPAGILDDAAQSALFDLTREKLDKLRDGYDVVVFDTEPIIRSSIALHLAALVDDVILVARSEVTRREVLRSTQNILDESGGKFSGAICNFRRFYIPNWVYRLLQ